MTQDEYIVANRTRRVEDVALELSRHPDLDAAFVLRQIEGYQRMRTKVPRWTEVEGIHFPPRLALEQCSGQPAAEYKAQVARRLLASSPPPAGGRWREADLTGGMGIDFSFIAPLFNARTYVEQREELVEAARHNFPLLGLGDAQIIHGDGVEYLKTLPQQLPVHERALPLTEGDGGGLFIFLDPARRDANGGKTVLIEDCEPNVAELLPILLAKARHTMVKLSPMLDLHRAIATLHAISPGCVSEVHVFASGSECKDLLLVITGEPAPSAHPVPCDWSQGKSPAEPTIYCADEHTTFAFTFDEENSTLCSYASPEALAPGATLYEPGPSIMKAGAFRTVATRYGLQKLHANTHLYTSPQPAADFPGRSFRIERTYTFAKADLKMLAADLKAEGGKANLTVRNFPSTVADLRKKLKIKEGGTAYLFATTDATDRKIIIRCSKC